MIRNLVSFLSRYRPNEWYSSKAAGLAGLLFLFGWYFQLPFTAFVKVIFPAFATLVGIAGFGYLLNDLTDMEPDVKAGKKNFIYRSSSFKVVMLFSAAVLLAAIPWFFLPFDNVILTMLAAEVLLFVVYSVPPVRAKEKPGAGLLVDALYAHVIPALLAAYTFWKVSEQAFPVMFFLLLGIWQFFVGIRNIVQHHIKDRKKDLASASYNYYNKRGSSVIKLVSKILFPAEVLCFLIFISTLGYDGVWFILLFVLFMADQAFTWRNAVVWRIKTKLNAGLFSPAFFYEHRIGLVAGFLMCLQDVWFAIPVLAYVLAFKIDLRAIYSFLVNVIYYKLLYWPFCILVKHPYYKHLLPFFHHRLLKSGYYYGHKVKQKFRLKAEPDQEN